MMILSMVSFPIGTSSGGISNASIILYSTLSSMYTFASLLEVYRGLVYIDVKFRPFRKYLFY